MQHIVPERSRTGTISPTAGVSASMRTCPHSVRFRTDEAHHAGGPRGEIPGNLLDTGRMRAGQEALDALCKVPNFVFHDFRHYLSTTMVKLHVPIDVTEVILNHMSGSRDPVQRVYDRYDRFPEMK